MHFVFILAADVLSDYRSFWLLRRKKLEPLVRGNKHDNRTFRMLCTVCLIRMMFWYFWMRFGPWVSNPASLWKILLELLWLLVMLFCQTNCDFCSVRRPLASSRRKIFPINSRKLHKKQIDSWSKTPIVQKRDPFGFRGQRWSGSLHRFSEFIFGPDWTSSRWANDLNLFSSLKTA